MSTSNHAFEVPQPVQTVRVCVCMLATARGRVVVHVHPGRCMPPAVADLAVLATLNVLFVGVCGACLLLWQLAMLLHASSLLTCVGLFPVCHEPEAASHHAGDHDKLNGDSPPCALMQQLSDTNVPGMIQELRDGHLLQLPAFLGLDGNEGNHPQLHELQQHIATAAQTDQS